MCDRRTAWPESRPIDHGQVRVADTLHVAVVHRFLRHGLRDDREHHIMIRKLMWVV